MNLRLKRVAVMGAVLCVAAPGAAAQAYPQRAMRLVVPFALGGSSDTLSRIIGQRLTESLGQAVVVDNRPAAGGTVGSDLVAKAQPDGYTMLLGSISNMAIAPTLYTKLPFDPLNDFAHVGLWVTFPLAMIVPAASPITNLKGFIEHARAKPGALRFSAQGIGTSSHIFAEWMNSLAKIKVVIVPYKGGGPALTGLMAGEVDYSMVAVSTALAQVQTGQDTRDRRLRRTDHTFFAERAIDCQRAARLRRAEYSRTASAGENACRDRDATQCGNRQDTETP